MGLLPLYSMNVLHEVLTQINRCPVTEPTPRSLDVRFDRFWSCLCDCFCWMRARLACLLSLSTHCRQVPYLFKASFILGIYQSENRRRIYKSYRRMRRPTSYFENTAIGNLTMRTKLLVRKMATAVSKRCQGIQKRLTECTSSRVVSRFLSRRFHPKSRRLFPFYFSNITLRTDLLTFRVIGAVFKIAGEMCRLPAYFDKPEAAHEKFIFLGREGMGGAILLLGGNRRSDT